MENKQAFLLKAKSVRQTKTGEPRDLGIYTIAVYNDGGWEAMDFMIFGYVGTGSFTVFGGFQN